MKKPVKKSPTKAKSWVEWRLHYKQKQTDALVYKTRGSADVAYDFLSSPKDWRIIKTRVTVIE
jgi:hypothetical protein